MMNNENDKDNIQLFIGRENTYFLTDRTYRTGTDRMHDKWQIHKTWFSFRMNLIKMQNAFGFFQLNCLCFNCIFFLFFRLKTKCMMHDCTVALVEFGRGWNEYVGKLPFCVFHLSPVRSFTVSLCSVSITIIINQMTCKFFTPVSASTWIH